MLGRATDSETAKFSSSTHCLLQVSVLKRGDSGPAALNARARALERFYPFFGEVVGREIGVRLPPVWQ